VSSKINLRPRPEEDELRLKRLELEDIEKELVEKELQLTGLRAELAAFERLYLKTVGALYAELDEIEARIAELNARRNPSNADAQETARQARRKATESQSAVGEIAPYVANGFSASPELKRLYREVARRIHPDLAIDEADRTRRQRFMAEANQAYERGDEARLRAILEEYESSPETVQGEGIAQDLVRTIRKIAQARRRLREIGEEMERVLGSELAQLKSRADEAIKQGRDLLEEMAESLRDEISRARRQLSDLGRVRT
jgi:DnaJ-domain-containing protein 1